MFWKSIAVALALTAAPSLGAEERSSTPLMGPRIGVVHCSDGSLRVLYGLPANLIYGPLLGRGVDASSFSNTDGLVLRGGRIEYLATDGSFLSAYATDETNPSFAINPASAGSPAASTVALAWVPSTHLLLTFSGPTVNQVEMSSLPGPVISLAFAAAGYADLMVAAADGTVERSTVSLATGEIVSTSTVPEASSAAYEQNGFLLLAGNDGLIVRFPDGHQQVLGIRADTLQFESIANDWVHLYIARTIANAGSHWLLHLDALAQRDASLELSELPGAPVRVPRIMPRQVANPMIKVAQ